MEPFHIRPGIGPEAKIQKRILNRLKMDGWFAKETHGNEFQAGFPDIFACHTSYGSRWIEVKQATGFKLKQSQRETFLAFSKRKIGVWILTDSTDWEMRKLFAPANWHTFLEVMRHNRAAKPDEPARKSKKQPDGPERQIQDNIKDALEAEGWYCKDTHGNIFQYGFPDLYVCHEKYGARWIEVKNPKGYVFTPAQLKTFPMFQANGVGVWVLTDASERDKLFKAANWWQFLDAYKS